MAELALVTGGAGFIGSHLADALLTRGFRVRVLDDLSPQAHPDGVRFVPADADLHVGDLRDARAVERALESVDVVFHLGGLVGNGQSMIDIRRYVDVNAVGTATLLEAIFARRDRVRRLIVASSMVVYGDGAYSCAEHGVVAVAERPIERLRRALWEPVCSRCGAEATAIALDEQHPLRPNSAYGVCKRDQEELCLVIGRAHRIPTIALRLLCTYGSRQALGNPYTGVAAIWAARMLNGRPPIVFEDGRQRRDFLHVSDAARAFIAAADAQAVADYAAFNIGSGSSCTIGELALALARALGKPVEPIASGEYREGDIRHCFADVSRAATVLGFRARTHLDAGLAEFCEWARNERPVDLTDRANAELRALGVIRGSSGAGPR